jgi:hypothetical protein
MSPSSSGQETSVKALLTTCFHSGLFLDLFFDPEDGGDISET